MKDKKLERLLPDTSLNYLLDTFDASIWAKEFAKMYPMILKDGEGAGPTEELMLTWFACAIMAGYDHANRQAALKESGYPSIMDIQRACELNYNQAKRVSDYLSAHFSPVKGMEVSVDVIKALAQMVIVARVAGWHLSEVKIPDVQETLANAEAFLAKLSAQPGRGTMDKEIEELAILMHNVYELKAIEAKWNTQESCHMKQWLELPEENRQTMMATAKAIIDAGYRKSAQGQGMDEEICAQLFFQIFAVYAGSFSVNWESCSEKNFWRSKAKEFVKAGGRLTQQPSNRNSGTVGNEERT